MAIGDKLFVADKPTLDKVDSSVGVDTDTASSNGSLHAKSKAIFNAIGAGVNFKSAVASDTSKILITTDVNSTSTTAEIKRAVFVNISGQIRVKFKLSRWGAGGAPTAYAEIRVNNILIKTENTTSTTYVTFTNDIYIPYGAIVSLWLYGSSTGGVLADDFEILYDEGSLIEVGQVL